MISLKFFNKKKIFITGHTGFKGSWLTLALLEMGAKVAGYSLKPKKDSNFKILKLEKYIETTYDDIQNQKLLQEKIYLVPILACMNLIQINKKLSR